MGVCFLDFVDSVNFRKCICLILDIFNIPADSCFLNVGKIRVAQNVVKTVLNDTEDHYRKSQSAKKILHNKLFF